MILNRRVKSYTALSSNFKSFSLRMNCAGPNNMIFPSWKTPWPARVKQLGWYCPSYWPFRHLFDSYYRILIANIRLRKRSGEVYTPGFDLLSICWFRLLPNVTAVHEARNFLSHIRPPESASYEMICWIEVTASNLVMEPFQNVFAHFNIWNEPDTILSPAEQPFIVHKVILCFLL